MKYTAKITSKGQITIPVEVRRELGVKEGDTVVFDTDAEGFRVVRKLVGESPFEKYRGIGNPGMPSGRDAILRDLREMSGRDLDEEEWEDAYERKMKEAAHAKKSA